MCPWEGRKPFSYGNSGLESYLVTVLTTALFLTVGTVPWGWVLSSKHPVLFLPALATSSLLFLSHTVCPGTALINWGANCPCRFEVRKWAVWKQAFLALLQLKRSQWHGAEKSVVSVVPYSAFIN